MELNLINQYHQIVGLMNSYRELVSIYTIGFVINLYLIFLNII
jgi:hypothetical protein